LRPLVVKNKGSLVHNNCLDDTLVIPANATLQVFLGSCFTDPDGENIAFSIGGCSMGKDSRRSGASAFAFGTGFSRADRYHGNRRRVAEKRLVVGPGASTRKIGSGSVHADGACPIEVNDGTSVVWKTILRAD